MRAWPTMRRMGKGSRMVQEGFLKGFETLPKGFLKGLGRVSIFQA